jgi:hypothetical protein
MRIALAVLVFTAACGSKSAQPTTPPSGNGDTGAEAGTTGDPERCERDCDGMCSEVEDYDGCMEDCGCVAPTCDQGCVAACLESGLNEEDACTAVCGC